MTKEWSVVCTAKPLTVANVRRLQIRCYLNRVILADMQLGIFALVNVLSVLKLRDYGVSGLYSLSDVQCVCGALILCGWYIINEVILGVTQYVQNSRSVAISSFVSSQNYFYLFIIYLYVYYSGFHLL
jgi:hypothetical protein